MTVNNCCDETTMTLSSGSFQTPATPTDCGFRKMENPYDFMPQAPRRRVVTSNTTDSLIFKKMLNKRLFLDLDLDDHFVPLMLSPRRNSFSNNNNNNKKAKTPSVFLNENDISPSSLIHESLIRMRNGKSLKRLKEERKLATNGNNTAMDTSSSNVNTKESGEDDGLTAISDSDHQAILASALLLSTAFSSFKEKRLSTKGNETKTSPTPSGVALGRRVERRDSGIARCA